MTITRNDNKTKSILLILVCGVLWGTIGPFIRWMELFGSSAILTSFLRVFFAFIILACITIGKFGVRSLVIGKKALILCALLGIICHGIYNVFYSLAVSLTGVTVSAVLLNIAPVFTAIISGLLFHEKITPWKICALLVNIVGCVLAATGGQVDIIIISLTGILCGVGAGFCYSMTAIIGRLSGEKSNPFVTSTYSYLFAAIFLAVFAKPWQGTISINYHVYLIGFLYALIPTAIAYLLYYRGVQLISNVSQVPVLASVETIVAGILGVSLFHDTLTITSLVGILLVLMSIVLMSSHKFDK